MLKLKKVCLYISMTLCPILFQCGESEYESVSETSQNSIDLLVEIKDNQAYLNWHLNDTSNIEGFTVERIYLTKKANIICDTCDFKSRMELEKNYTPYKIDYLLRSNDLTINSFIDSTFSYSEGLFYNVTTISLKDHTSDFVKLKLPILPKVEVIPYKTLIDKDLDLLVFLDIYDKVKIVTYDLNKETVAESYNFNIDGTNFAPKPDMCIGSINGRGKLILALRNEIFVFDLQDLILEWTFQLDEYLGAIAFKDNYIYSCDNFGQIYKLDLSEETVVTTESELFPISYNYKMLILNDYLYFFTIFHTGPHIIKYQIQDNGDLIKIMQKDFSDFILYDIDCDPSKSIFLLSNGYILDKDLNIYQDLNFTNPYGAIAITDIATTITHSIPSTKEIIVYDLLNGKIIKQKKLLSYPLFIRANNQNNFGISDFNGSVCIELF